MSFEFADILGSLVIVFAIIAGTLSYKQLFLPEKIVLTLIVLSLITERIATICIQQIRNSNVVYGAFSPIEVLLICIYYNYSIDVFKRNNISMYIGLSAFVFGFINYFWIQSPFQMNNFFLLLESIIIITLSLYSFYRMLLADESLILTNNPHFWFSSIFLFFWTATFFIWGLYDYMTIKLSVGRELIHSILTVVNVVTYVGFGLVYIFYKKMSSANG